MKKLKDNEISLLMDFTGVQREYSCKYCLHFFQTEIFLRRQLCFVFGFQRCGRWQRAFLQYDISGKIQMTGEAE